MIPTHQSDITQRNELVVNHLAKLNTYDFTEPHRHDYFEFFYFLKGGGSHSIDFEEFLIEDNTVHIVAPGQVHQMQRALDSEGYVLLFELPALSAPVPIEAFLFEHICLDALELNPCYHLMDEQRIEHIDRIRRIFELGKNSDELSQMKLKNEVQMLCIACMELSPEGNFDQPSDYMRFRSLLKSNYLNQKKVKDYAEMLHMTERSLNELVKRKTGKSASEIIYSQLIMEAKRLLRTGISVKDAAYALNFDDPAHFSKFFKSQTSFSPSDFQNYT